MAYREAPPKIAIGQRISIPRFGAGARALALVGGLVAVCILVGGAELSLRGTYLACRHGREPGTASCAVMDTGFSSRVGGIGPRSERAFTFARVVRRIVQDDGPTESHDVLVLDHNGSDPLEIADIGIRGWRARSIASEFNAYVASGAVSSHAWSLRTPSHGTAGAMLVFALVFAAFIALYFRRIRISFDARERGVIIVVPSLPRAQRFTARIDDIDRVERVDSEDEKGEVCSVRMVMRGRDGFDLGLHWRNPDRVDEVVTRISGALTEWRASDRAFATAPT